MGEAPGDGRRAADGPRELVPLQGARTHEAQPTGHGPDPRLQATFTEDASKGPVKPPVRESLIAIEFVDELVSEETWGGPEPEDDSADPMKALLRKQQTAQRRTDALQGGTTEGQTLPSAATLFLNVKKVLRRCSNLTRGKPLCALHLVFVNVLTAYADRLRKRCDAAGTLLRTDMKQKDPEKLTAEYRCLCLVVNTAEWCAQTVTPLGESVTRMLADDNLKTRIDSDSIEDAFHQLVTHALGTLVSGVETRTEVAVGVTKVNWSQVESTGEIGRASCRERV